MIKEFPFHIDAKLEYKLELLTKQLRIKDVWILVDGDEGSGKTNMLSYLLYYFHCATGREFTIERLYFDSEAMFEWAKSNSNGLIGWDEACLGGLSIEWWNRSQINLLKFAMMGRKKHHVFVLCIPRFDKLKEDLRIDRTHALIHMNCGRKNDKYGHYMYITRRGKKELNRLWKLKHIRCYERAMRKYGGFGGWIPYVFPKLYDEDTYEKKKDEAISSIGKRKIDETKQQFREFKSKLTNIKFPVQTKKEFARLLGLSYNTFKDWRLKATPLEMVG